MSTLSERVDRLGRAFQELAHTAQDRLESALEVGSKKIDLLGLKRSVDRETRALGELTLQHLRGAPPPGTSLADDPSVRVVVDRLAALEKEVATLEADIQAARHRAAGRGPGPDQPSSTPRS